MKTIRRLALLALFVAIGSGLAIGVAVTTVPASAPQKATSGELVAVATLCDDEPEGAEHRVPARRQLEQPAALGSLHDDIDARPIIMAPHPRVGANYPPAASSKSSQPNTANLEATLQQLLERMPAATNGSKGPAAAAGVPDAATLDALKALGVSAPAALPPSPLPNEPKAAPAPAAKAADTTVVSKKPIVRPDPTGDGKLSIHIQNSDIREVLDLLSEAGGLNILAGKEVTGKVSASLTGVDIQSALDAILKSTGYVTRREGAFIYVGSPEEFNTLEQSLDRIATRVYRPNYVTAAELKALVQPLLTERVGLVSVSSPSESGIAANDSIVGGDKYAGGEVIIVRDYEAVLAQVDQMVAEVDVRPMQVAIEAMILSVKLDDSDHMGVNFALLRDHLRFGWGSPPISLDKMVFDSGMKLAYLDGNIAAFVDALSKISDTNVIATPRLMVLNKHRAQILIGQKKGYVSTTTVTETASTQSVEYLETGAQLRLRPFISQDGVIRMEIHPELSDGDVEKTDKFTLPYKNVTEVTTNIMIRDGCTVVIGGLLKESLSDATQSVPLLGALPWVGALFRNTTQTKQRQELIVLITPRIMYDPTACKEGDKAACEFHRANAVYAEKMTPLNRRSLGKRYFRLAQAAWAKGDRNTALRLAEMAVHFDPLSKEAIDLRADIWQGRRVGDHTLDIVAGPALGPSVVDSPELSDWVLDELKRPPAAPMPLHPLDPGQPGQRKDLPRPRRLP